MKSYPFICLICFFLLTLQTNAQQTIPLYSDSIPNSTGYQMIEIPVKYKDLIVGSRKISQPSLSIFRPSKPNGSAIIICPGGGYSFENSLPEGKLIADVFTRKGITAFVLKYRLPSDSIMRDKSIGPLQDAQQALKLVREKAKEWKIDGNKVGIMGFSAGGHLAATAATHFNTGLIPNPASTNLRPDFLVLIYPVISFTVALAHKGSKSLLIGDTPTDDKVRFFSNEQQVTEQTPPTWLTHTGDDSVVPVDNSILFYQALVKHKVPTEMHLYPTGDHGFVLNQPTEDWMKPLFAWMKKNGWSN
jgi:acetyl esterase/lipase